MSELVFEYAVNSLGFLFFTKLESVFGNLSSAVRVGAGSYRSLLERASRFLASVAFKEEFCTFASAKTAFSTTIFSHFL